MQSNLATTGTSESSGASNFESTITPIGRQPARTDNIAIPPWAPAAPQEVVSPPPNPTCYPLLQSFIIHFPSIILLAVYTHFVFWLVRNNHVLTRVPIAIYAPLAILLWGLLLFFGQLAAWRGSPKALSCLNLFRGLLLLDVMILLRDITVNSKLSTNVLSFIPTIAVLVFIYVVMDWTFRLALGDAERLARQEGASLELPGWMHYFRSIRLQPFPAATNQQQAGADVELDVIERAAAPPGRENKWIPYMSQTHGKPQKTAGDDEEKFELLGNIV